MMARRFLRHMPEFSVALCVAVCAIMLVLVYRMPSSNTLAPGINPFFVLRPQSVTEEVIADYAGVRRTYEFDMKEVPTGSGRYRTIFVYLRHTIAELYMGETLVADFTESDAPHIGHTPGNYWLSLPIYADYGERIMRVTLTPVYNSVRDEQPLFLLIDREALIDMMILPQEGLLLALSLIAAAAGVFLMLTALTLGLEAQDRKRVFYLGAVAIAAGVWKFCGLSIVPLLLDYLGLQTLLWFAGTVGYLLMMVFSLRLLTVLRTEGDGRVGAVCCCFSAAVALLLVLLQALNLVELHDVLVWYGFGMASLHLIALFGQKPDRGELLWLLPTFLALGVDLVIFLRRGSIATAPVFLVWIIGNLFVRGFGFLRAALTREKALRLREEELRDARSRAMMSQIRPHFIYNTLSSIYVLCRDDAARAMQVIQDFTAYLQANFTAIAATEPITFLDELQHTKAYLAVESMRYAERLSVEYDTPHTAFRLPALTLQPLVENAVKHGVNGANDTLHIAIRTRDTESGSAIIVEDDGAGFAETAGSGGEVHVGLQNVRERLEMMCSGTLTITSRPSGGTIVTVLIPPIA